MNEKKVRLGFIGVGGNGKNLLKHSLKIEYVEIPAICDLKEENLHTAQSLVEESGRRKPEGYYEHKESFRDLLAREDLDGVVISTPWRLHIPMAIATVKSGKYAATEVGPASSIEECWELVKTSEETGMPCMILENHCYNRDCMAVLSMVRKGLFGELIHCQCGYQHELRRRIVKGKGTGVELEGGGDFRTHQNRKRNADLYPTHGIGPVAEFLNINRGNRFVYLTSTATKSRGLHDWTVENLGKEHPYADIDWAIGDVVTTVIKCYNGETVIINHDCSLPRPYSNMRRVQGTKGIWMEDNNSIYLEGRSPEHKWESFDKYQTEFEHPLWQKYIKEGIKAGHGGAGFLKVRAFVECIKRKISTPIDVYDTAIWMAITPLSEKSIALGSEPVYFPDFTQGKWMTNKPIFGLTEEY